MDTVAKFLIEYLYSKNIDTYFGIPGGPIGYLFDALYRTSGTTLIESRHETAALFEAIGYYKTTGKIPVVLVTAGPGITNSLTGMASAKALRVPVLLLCGDTAWEKQNHILLQTGGPEGIDIERTFAPHTDHIIRHHNPIDVVQEIANLLNTRNNLSPSICVLPHNISSARVKKPIVSDVICKSNYKGSHSRIDKKILQHIASFLQEATHPLVVVGYGARTSVKEVTQFISNVEVPFVTTPQAKGLISETHKLSLRHAGIGASQWARKYIKNTPDVVIALGTDLDDCAVGTTEFIGKKTKLIHIDINSRVFNRKYKTEIAIQSSIKNFCQEWKKLKYKNSTNQCIDLEHLKNGSAFDVPYFKKDNSLPIAPHRVLGDLEDSCPPNVRFVTDIGEHMLFSVHYLTIKEENQFSIDLGLGSMGSGICQSIGMCLGDRRPTICICGDGCFQMHGMEILTAIKHKLPIIFVIFNDARYNMVSYGFQFSFGLKRSPGQTDIIDFVKIGEALGIKSLRIEEGGKINAPMIKSLFDNAPCLLDVRINKDIHIKGAGRNEVLKQMGE